MISKVSQDVIEDKKRSLEESFVQTEEETLSKVLSSVKEKEAMKVKLRKSNLKIDYNLIKKFLSSIKESLILKKNPVLLTEEDFLKKIYEFYVSTFSIKKQLLYNKHYDDFKENCLDFVSRYKVTFEDTTIKNFVFIWKELIAQLV